ncbi:meiosis regulator and mRNA stability factor 1 isoform X7 [Cherax quadricarinatus]|uniref:meiosis regulator and mRNA stability factor 1 isoform X7 n=1 Tax=Cherax quadricarinatus TaxID=27406 RepID=UPI00387ECCAE
MIGKTDFPEVLPLPPSPTSVESLLGPMDFSSENFENYDNSSNFSIDVNDFNDLSNNLIKISGQSTALSAGHGMYSSSSSSSSVSVTQSELLGTGENTHSLTNKDCPDLYPVVEFLDGKEVITITTSNTVPNNNTLSATMSGFKSGDSVPTCVGKTSTSFNHINQKEFFNPIKEKSNSDNVSTVVENEVSHLLTPFIFASVPSCSNSGTSSTELETSSELPSVTPRYAQVEEMQRMANVSNQTSLITTCSQTVQMNCNSSKYKDGSSESEILLTPDRFASADHCAETKNENRLCSSDCLCRLYVPSTLEADLMTSDYEDDIEQDLKDIEEMEEEEKKKEERQTQHHSALSYDSGRLPPIGVFWDIENCQVPKGLSATHVVQAIRARFFNEHREAEFMCVCDTLKENSKILEELNDAQVNVMHVGSTVKNAADDKLLQSMRRFADIHGTGATIVLISGDSNFATELYDLRYRKNLRVIIVHNAHAQDSLKLCAHETALFTEVTQELPQRSKPKGIGLRRDIFVSNLPDGVEEYAIRRRLNILSANCGGKVGRVRVNCATIYFQTPELATRAKKRLDGEDVFGNKINCSFGKSSEKEGSPKIKCGKFLQQQSLRDKESEVPDCVTSGFHTVQSPSQAVMGEVGATSLPWRIREPLVETTPLHQQYSAFRSYTKTPATPVTSEQQYSSQRMWRNSGCKSQSQASVGVNGSFSGILQDYDMHNGESVANSTAVQPLYLDKTPETFKKGRSQKVQFRMSSPPSFSLSTRLADSYLLDNNLRMRSPSPLLSWSGVSPMKHTWSLPTTSDLQGQVLCGLRELSLGDGAPVDTSLGSTSQVPVELQVTNLDQNIDAREMKRILFTVFRDHVMVLHVSVFVQSDGNLAATLRVPSQQDAQYAISQLHRKKIGAKRIIISYVNHNQPSPELKRSGMETTIAIPKREQTPEEIERTRQFAAEVVELLRHSPQCKMQFNRFIPAYHHHFGRQCRVADYGFSKLIELFEAIPDILQVYDDDEDGEKQLQLVERERIKVLGDQVSAVVKGAPHQAIRISALTQVFTRYYGYSLKPDHYGSNSLEELIGKLRNHVKMVDGGDEPIVNLVDRGYVHEVMLKARHLLWNEPLCCLSLDKFVQSYAECYNHPPNLEIIKRDLEEVLTIEGETDGGKICLVPLQIFARDLLTLLHESGGRMLLLNFDTAYLDRFGIACRPATYGFPNIVALVQALGDLVAVRGRGTKRILVLNREVAPSPPFFSVTANSTNLYSENVDSVDENGVSKPPPASQLPPPHRVSSPPQCDYQPFLQEANSNGHLVMSMNPQIPQQPYQSSPPVVYPGSPAPTGGSLMWGQMWSPQYPVMPPLSPGHYMVPTIPMSWGNVAASPIGAVSSTSPPAPLLNSMVPPISIHTLDELSKQEGKGNGDYSTPPKACELPSPELFTQIPPSEPTPATIPVCDIPQTGLPTCGEDEAEDTWSSCNSDSGKVDVANTSTPSGPKLPSKRRIAAQFTAS